MYIQLIQIKFCIFCKTQFLYESDNMPDPIFFILGRTLSRWPLSQTHKVCMRLILLTKQRSTQNFGARETKPYISVLLKNYLKIMHSWIKLNWLICCKNDLQFFGQDRYECAGCRRAWTALYIFLWCLHRNPVL